MKKLWVVIGVIVLLACELMAQDFKVSKSTGKLDIRDLNDVEIEGTIGNEIVFSSRDGKRENDERAKGLKAITAMGLEDNTGFGLSVVEKGDVIEVRQLKKMGGPTVRILVPKGVSISLSHSTPHGSDIIFRNVEGEIEVSTVHNDVNLDSPTGPVTINTVHGDIEVKMAATFKSPVSLISVHGSVDLALPLTTKATLKMSTSYGEIFVDPDFKLQVDTSGGLAKYSSNTVTGKINGGGLDITLSSSHGSVYLRKK
jgi:Putative adhesin